MNNPIAKPVTVITGASRGIGYALAVQLADQGHHIVAIARTVGGLEKLADEVGNDNITLVPQDLKDGQALESLGPLLLNKLGRIDYFIANAGMLGTLSPLAQSDPKQWDDIFAINVRANLHLLRSLDPMLRQADKPHIVFVTSSVAKHPRAYWGAYAASKAALENMAGVYADEVENTSMNVHIFDPGATATKMRAAAFPGENPDNLPSPEETATKIVDLLRG